MKKLFVLILISLVGFLAYKFFFSNLWNKGAFDKNGNPMVIVFIMDDCGAPCAAVVDFLKRKNTAFEEISASSDQGAIQFEKFGGGGFPLTVVGNYKILGDNLTEIETVLAEAYGIEVFGYAEQTALRSNFDDKGNPIVVMYGTSWCKYTKKMRKYLDEHNIPYTEFDIEANTRAKSNYETLKGIGYPLIYVGYRRIDGYDEAQLNKAVNEVLQDSPQKEKSFSIDGLTTQIKQLVKQLRAAVSF